MSVWTMSRSDTNFAGLNNCFSVSCAQYPYHFEWMSCSKSPTLDARETSSGYFPVKQSGNNPSWVSAVISDAGKSHFLAEVMARFLGGGFSFLGGGFEPIQICLVDTKFSGLRSEASDKHSKCGDEGTDGRLVGKSINPRNVKYIV